MSEMIERVARAIYEGRNGRGCKSWSLLPKSHREPYQKDARVALEAVREPSDAMLAAPIKGGFPMEPASYSGNRSHLWRAMIDIALAPAPLPQKLGEAP